MDSGEYFIASRIGNVFVSAISYSRDPDMSLLSQVADMKDACDKERKAFLLKSEDIDYFQMGDTNPLIQSVIYLYKNAWFQRDISDEIYGTVYHNDNPRCISVNSKTNFIENNLCPENVTLTGLLCYANEGQILELKLEAISCIDTDPTNRMISIEYRLQANIVGCLNNRIVTCMAVYQNGKDVPGTMSSHVLTCKNNVTFDVILKAEDPYAFLMCTGMKYFETALSPNITVVEYLPNMEPTLRVHNSTVAGTSNNKIYLDQSDYSSPFDVILVSEGFPAPEIEYSFEKMFENPLQNQTTEELSDKQAFCFSSQQFPIAVNIVNRVKLTFDPLEPKHSGKYHVFIRPAFNGSSIPPPTFFELVHPFSIQCSPTCPDKVYLGPHFKVQCAVNHHLITRNDLFDTNDQMPLNITISRKVTFLTGKALSTLSDEINPLEFNTALGSRLAKQKLRDESFKVDSENRNLSFDFVIYSVQIWNSGRYAIQVVPADEIHCVYQSPYENCLHAPSSGDSLCDESTTANEIQVLVHPDDKGFAEIEADSCGPYTRALFFQNVTNQNGDQNDFAFYYNLCPRPSPEYEPEKVCSKNGGEFQLHETDFITTFMSSTSNIPDKYTLEYLWMALFHNVNVSLSQVKTTGNLSFPKVYTFYKGEPGMLQLSFLKMDYPETETNLVLCKYRRGKAWNMANDGGNCTYQVIDPHVGTRQQVRLSIHGQLPINAKCSSIPAGLFPATEFFGVSEDTGILYALPFPNNLAVGSFFCCQIYPSQMIGEENDSDCFHFNLTAQFKDINVQPVPKSNSLWCKDSENETFSSQPCYHTKVEVECCFVANPILHCNWSISLGRHSHIVNGEDGISWTLRSTENPRCMNPEYCSVLTFDPLLEEHQGLYHCSCFNGLETMEMPEQLLREPGKTYSQNIKIASRQSQPATTREKSVSLELVCAETRKFSAVVKVSGLPVTADVFCRSDEGVSYTKWPQNKVNVVRQVEKSDEVIHVDLTGVNRRYDCFIQYTNDLAENPLRVRLPLQHMYVTGEMNFRQDNSSENFRSEPVKVCCDVCAFHLDLPRYIRIKCFLVETSEEVPLQENMLFTFNIEGNNASKCVQLVDIQWKTFECSCTAAGNYEKSLVFYANGEVEEFRRTASPRTGITQKVPDSVIEKAATTSNPKSVEVETTTYWKTQSAILAEILTKAAPGKREGRDKTKPLTFTEMHDYMTSLEHVVSGMEILSDRDADIALSFMNEIKGANLTFDNNEDDTQKIREWDKKKAYHDTLEAFCSQIYNVTNKIMQRNKILRGSEEKLAEIVSKIQSTYLHVASQLDTDVTNNLTFEFAGGNSNVFLMKIPEEGENLKEALSLDVIDHNGVTQGVIQSKLPCCLPAAVALLIIQSKSLSHLRIHV